MDKLCGTLQKLWTTAKTFEVPRGHVTVTDSLRQIFPTRSSDDVMQMMTVLHCFFCPEYPWFIAVRLDDKAKFDALCKNGKYPKVAACEMASKYSQSAALCAADKSEFSCFRAMFRAFACHVLQEIYSELFPSPRKQLVFRGLHYDIREQLDAHLGQIIADGFPEPESFSTSVHTAQTFLQHGSNIYEYCLQKDGYIRNETGQLHALLLCDGYNPKFSGRLNAMSDHEDEVWLQDTSAHLLERSTDASTLLEVMKCINVPESDQAVILQAVQDLNCEVIVVTKADRTLELWELREAAAASTVPTSRSSRDDAAARGPEVLSKQPKRKFFSVSQGMFVDDSDSQSGKSDAEASDGGSIAKVSSTDAASEMSEDEDAEDALLVVVDPQKQWTTMEDRAGSSIMLVAAQLRDHPLLPPCLSNPDNSFADVDTCYAFPRAHCALNECPWTSDRKLCQPRS